MNKKIVRTLSLCLILSTLFSLSVSALPATQGYSYLEAHIDQYVEDEINLAPVLIDADTGGEIAWIISPSGDYEISTRNFELKDLVAKISVKKSGSKFVWTVNIDNPASLNKPKISVNIDIQTNTYTGTGSFSSLKSYKIDEVNYIKNYTFETTPRTAYYRGKVTFTDLNSGNSSTVYTATNLYNKSANRWAFSYYDSTNGKSLLTPAANLTAVANPISPGSYRADYLKEYERLYDVNLLDIDNPLDKWEIHHQVPRQYGGNNSFSNLIHLKGSLHHKINGWYNGY